MNNSPAFNMHFAPLCRLLLKNISLLILTLPALTSAQEYVIGESKTIHSEILNEDRPYLVSLPASYHNDPYGPGEYAVLYILDGTDTYFHAISGMVRFMSAGDEGNYQIPELIVVAIPSTDRIRDETPTQATYYHDGTARSFLSNSGGANEFLRFMQEELMPKIEAEYRTKAFRLIAGHSLGGTLAAHSFLEHNALFQGYLLIDPALWWDHGYLVERAEKLLKQQTQLKGQLFIGIANNTETGLDDTIHTEKIEAFVKRLNAEQNPSFNAGSHFYDNEDHSSVILRTIYDGLLHSFAGYKQSLQTIHQQPLSLLESFADLSKRLGHEFQAPGALVELMAFQLIERGNPQGTLTLLKANAELYPTSARAFANLGLAYSALGDKVSARQHYEKALELEPENENLKAQLDALNQE